MAKVLYRSIGKSYDNSLITVLEQLGHSVQCFPVDDSSNWLQAISDSAGCTIIVPIEDDVFMKEIDNNPAIFDSARVLLISPFTTWGNRRYPLPVANVETEFSGRLPTVGIANQYFNENKFYSKVKEVKNSGEGNGGCIVGLGIVYGGDGCDLEHIFKAVYSGSTDPTLLLSYYSGTNKVPMIHVQDFGVILSSLIRVRVDPAVSASPLPMNYYPACVSTGATRTVHETFTVVAEQLGCQFQYTTQKDILDIMMTISASKSPVAVSQTLTWLLDLSFDIEECRQVLIDALCGMEVGVVDVLGEEDPPLPNLAELLATHIDLLPPPPPTPNTMELGRSSTVSMKIKVLNYVHGWSDIYRDFLVHNNMTPCVVAIAGPPKSLKTKMAKDFSSRLSLQYVDSMGSLNYMFSYNKTPVDSSSVAISGSNANIAARKQKLVDCYKQKLSNLLDLSANQADTGKKGGGKKGAAAAAGAGNAVIPMLEDLSAVPEDAIKASVSKELIRQCIALRLTLDTHCTLKGVVLDIWDFTTIGGVANVCIIESYEDLVDLFHWHQKFSRSLLSPMEVNFAASPRPDDELTLVDKENMLSSARDIPMLVLPDCIIELFGEKDAIVKGFVNTLGVPPDTPVNKMTKEQQAAIAQVEAQLNNYITTAAMTIPEIKKTTLKGVHDIEEHFSSKAQNALSKPYMMRSDVGNTVVSIGDQSDALEKIVDVVTKQYQLDTCHGPVGWSPSYSPTPAAAAPEDQQTGESPSTSAADNDAAVANVSDSPKDAGASVEASTAVMNMEAMNQQLSVIDSAQDANSVVEHCDEFQQYLVTNVLSHVAECLIKLARHQRGMAVGGGPSPSDADSMDDPIAYLYTFLANRGSLIQEQAGEAAYKNFTESLSPEELDTFLSNRKKNTADDGTAEDAEA